MNVAQTTAPIHPSVEQFIAKPRQILINGRWQNAASGKTFSTVNPATGETLASISEGNHQDIQDAVHAARLAFDQGPWRRMTPSERGKLIWKLADLLEEHLEEFAQLESLERRFRRHRGWPTSVRHRPPQTGASMGRQSLHAQHPVPQRSRETGWSRHRLRPCHSGA